MSNEAHFRESKLKWLFFALWSLFSLGSNYAFDNPSALKDLIFEERRMELSREDFELLFSGFYIFYSIPNIIFPVANGILMDKVGVKKMLIFLSLLIILGQFLVFVGCSRKDFVWMFLGRLIFGFGSESLTAAQNVYINRFFDEDSLAFPIATGNAVSLIGTYLNFALTAEFARIYGLRAGFLSGLFFCMASLITIFFAIFLESLLLKPDPEPLPSDPEENSALISLEGRPAASTCPSKQTCLFPHFSRPFNLLLTSSVIVYASSVGFGSISVSYFSEKWFRNLDVKAAEAEAGKVMSLDSLANIVTSILLSGFMHYSRKFMHYLPAVNSLVSVLAFSLFLGVFWPIPTLLLDGVSSSLNYNILNTMIPRLVPEGELGVAYCIAIAGNNLGTLLVPISAALLRNLGKNYDGVIAMLIGLNGLGVGLSLLFWQEVKTIKKITN